MVFWSTELILNWKSVFERIQIQLCDWSTCLIMQWAAVTAHCRLMVAAPQSWAPTTCRDNCDMKMEWAAALRYGTLLPKWPPLRNWHFFEPLVLSSPCIVHVYRLLVPKNTHIILIYVAHYLYALRYAMHMNSVVRANVFLYEAIWLWAPWRRQQAETCSSQIRWNTY
jgi:hypothetical protein